MPATVHSQVSIPHEPTARAPLFQLYSHPCKINSTMSPEKPSITLPGTVEKIIKPPVPTMPEKAQISVEGADDLYKEIRLENALTDENGREVKLKEGAKIEVTVEADPKDTTPAKSPSTSHT